MFWGELSDVINCCYIIGVIDGWHSSDPCHSYDSPQNDWGGEDTFKRFSPRFFLHFELGFSVGMGSKWGQKGWVNKLSMVCWGGSHMNLGGAQLTPKFHGTATTCQKAKVKRYAIQARGMRHAAFAVLASVSWMTHPVVYIYIYYIWFVYSIYIYIYVCI